MKSATNTYNYVGSNPTTYKDSLGLLNLAAWDERHRKTYENNKALIEEAYQSEIRNCIIAYSGAYGIEGHRDKCKLDECITNNSENYQARYDDNQEFHRKGLENNPFSNFPRCPSLPKLKLKPPS